VSFTQAALGTEAEVPTPYGPASLKVPRGTQTGAVYRLRGKGLPRLGESGRGDLHVRVHVWTPATLTPEQERVMQELARVESAPPAADGAGRGFWNKLREALGG
jgi:molecular chaperone DnaJ